MKVIGNTIGVLLVLACVGALGVGGYLGANRLVKFWMRLDFQVAAVAAIALALLLAAMIVGSSMRYAGRQFREAQLHAGKVEAYGRFIALWEELLQNGQTIESVPKLSRQMREANHLLMLYGDGAVVKAHAAMQESDLASARTQFRALLPAIRSDLGLDMRGMEVADMARLLLAEPDPAPPAIPAESSPALDRQPRITLAARI
ncbi:MAG TPA: hypothetical protein VKU19_37260 [Bryobacteraceae bacterium]|nr:hypothetical protein [Bryobacteraceae bacterium]